MLTPIAQSPPAFLNKPTGYHMSAEWEPHEATWLSWPHNLDTWPAELLSIVQDIYLDMVQALVPGEKVHILVNDEQMKEDVRVRLEARGIRERVFLHPIPTDDAWIRDNGPSFVVGPKGLAINRWFFNSWGEKYSPWDQDSAVSERVAALLNVPLIETRMVLEGGSIDVNGQGICLTTRQCLLNPKRNPHLNQKEIEQALQNYLGVEQVIWLGEGIVGDDTDGHVDDIARFVNPTTIVCAIEEDPSDENHKVLQENLRKLRQAKDHHGQPLTMVTLPMPKKVANASGRLPASYLNFYIANRVVLVPLFDDPLDAMVLSKLREFFPERQVVGIPGKPLVWGLGAVHCLTQQQPVA